MKHASGNQTQDTDMGTKANQKEHESADSVDLKGKRVFTEQCDSVISSTRSASHSQNTKLEPKRTFDPQESDFSAIGASSSTSHEAELDADAMMQESVWQGIVEQQSLTSYQGADTGLVGDKCKKQKKGIGLLGRLALLSFVALLITELGLSLYGAWQTSAILFALYATAISLGGAWLVRRIYQEAKLLRRLKKQSGVQEDTARLLQSMQMGEAEKLIGRMMAHQSASKTEAYYRMTNEQHNDAEKLILFEQTVLLGFDDEAKKVVSRFAAESALLLAASPLALLDMGIILWRNQAMITRIADIYGIELGYWSRIKLIRGVITNILYAGTSELVADLGTQMLSVEMSGKLSARLAQGLGGGLLTARLGYQAMAFCRPIHFSPKSKPKLSKIHQELLSELKSFSVAAMKKGRNKEFTSIDK